VGALKALCAAILLAAPVPAASQIPGQLAGTPQVRPDERGIDRWSSHIREASARFGIPEDWIRRVIRAESGGRTRLGGRPITSSAGAMGLMQLMPGTWCEMRSKYRLGRDPHDPRDNILAGTAYLRAMYDRFGYPGLFAAYNAGPGRYSGYLAGAGPLPAETVAYLAALGPDRPGQSRASAAIVGGGSLFVRLSNAIPPDIGPPPPAATAPGSDPELFVRLEALSPAAQ
jgi:soluble lytic murein transglycosylase-like protein